MAKADLASQIEKIMADYVGALPAQIEAAQKKAAKAVVKQLKATSPQATGKYAKGWKSSTSTTRTGAVTTIYNGQKPGLTHLLEYGHPIISGGRTVGQAKAFPHIADAEEAAITAYEAALKEELEK